MNTLISFEHNAFFGIFGLLVVGGVLYLVIRGVIYLNEKREESNNYYLARAMDEMYSIKETDTPEEKERKSQAILKSNQEYWEYKRSLKNKSEINN